MSSPSYQNLTTYRNDDDGYSVPYLAQFYGDEEDIDGAFPYVDNHESWFIHDEASEKYNQRCTNGWDDQEYSSFCYWMDLDSRWSAYVDTNLRQLLGEDCYDGWQLDGAHSNWVASPEFYDGEGLQGLYEYLFPRLTNLFVVAGEGAAGHSLRPYVFAQTFRGWSLQPEAYGPPAFDISACDGIIVDRFLDDDRGVENRMWEFTDYVGDMTLEWQSAGKSVILQSIMRGSDYYPFTCMSEYCCYLLVRGPQTYFYATPDPQYSRAVYENPYWYPMYTWDSGAPLGPQPESMADLAVESPDLEGNPTGVYYYRRNFENGFVLLVPNFAFEHWDSGIRYEYLDVSGGGAVAADGGTQGTWQWTPLSPHGTPGFYIDIPSAWILRPIIEDQG